MITNIVVIIVNKVLTKNNEADCWILLTTLRPSATTCGIEAKLESNKTSWATFFTASHPEAIAILQSASFKAKISLIPSPVIATVCLASFKALTNNCFWWGLTRPKTVYFSATANTSSSDIPSKLM